MQKYSIGCIFYIFLMVLLQRLFDRHQISIYSVVAQLRNESFNDFAEREKFCLEVLNTMQL